MWPSCQSIPTGSGKAPLRDAGTQGAYYGGSGAVRDCLAFVSARIGWVPVFTRTEV